MTAALDAPRPPTPGASPPASRARWWVLAPLGLAQLMVVLDATVVNIALPSAQADLGFDDGARQWVVSAYALAFGSLLLLGGRVGDVLGRARVFVALAVAGGLALLDRRRAPERPRIDVLGTVLATAGLFALVDACSQALT